MQAHSDNFSPYLLTLFPVYFFAVWALAIYSVGWLTGWRLLSRDFEARSEPYGDTRSVGPWFCTVYMRFWGHYSSVIRMTAAEDALYLSVSFMFRIGHPPLCIPWSEITVSRTKRFWRSYVVLTLGNQEGIPFRISERIARKLGILERFREIDDPSRNPTAIR